MKWNVTELYFDHSPPRPLCSSPDFSIPGQMSQKNGGKKDLIFFEGYLSCCWACYCLCNVWHVRVRWFLGTAQTTAYMPCERLGLQQTNHIWNTTSRDITYMGTADKCWSASKFIWAKFLRSWRKHIQENRTYGRLPAHQQSSAGQSPRKHAGRAQKYPLLIELTPFKEVIQAATSKPHFCWWCHPFRVTILLMVWPIYLYQQSF